MVLNKQVNFKDKTNNINNKNIKLEKNINFSTQQNKNLIKSKINNFKEKINTKKKNKEKNNKQMSHINDLLKTLSTDKGMSKNNTFKENDKMVVTKNIKNNINNQTEFDTYKEMINEAISNKFYNYSDYIGKTCNLHIKLDSNGKLIFIKPISGNSKLCKAAISAAKFAKFPKPPSIQIYNIFKNSILKFSPQ